MILDPNIRSISEVVSNQISEVFNFFQASIIQTHSIGVENLCGKFGVCITPLGEFSTPPHIRGVAFTPNNVDDVDDWALKTGKTLAAMKTIYGFFSTAGFSVTWTGLHQPYYDMLSACER
uniref:Uncharacterized protein n=1 Tax=Glossina morsitans morsitans TaxID=37546 RepID=A0A1B0GA85_GLOMM